MLLIYGANNQNAYEAARKYVERYPNRRAPNPNVFLRLINTVRRVSSTDKKRYRGSLFLCPWRRKLSCSATCYIGRPYNEYSSNQSYNRNVKNNHSKNIKRKPITSVSLHKNTTFDAAGLHRKEKLL